MKKHIKNYLDFFDYTISDVILCECCSCVAVDIHHIKFKSRGGSDQIDNLIALCRNCHELSHAGILIPNDLKSIHLSKMGR